MDPLSPFLVKLFLVITVMLGGGPWPGQVPEVYLVNDEVMSMYRPAVCGKYPPVAYFVGENRIILSDRLKPFDNPNDASILVHELQHHIQASSRESANKKRNRVGIDRLRFYEREAYHIQDRFLRLIGENPTFSEDMLKC